MAAITKITRAQGENAILRAYAAVDALVLSSFQALPLHVNYAALTGAMTINVTLTALQQFQDVTFYFTSDATSRTVTLGTGFLQLTSIGMTGTTFLVPASLDATVRTVYDGVSLRVVNLMIGGRGRTTESPAYAATLEVTDQFAVMHIISPAQLTGALTISATAVTKWVVGDEAVFHFSTDGTQRIVTFGVGILSSGTVTIPASKTATARGFFNGTSICILSREISL